MTYRDPAYLGNGQTERRRIRDSSEWLDKLADNVTLEGSAIRGLLEGIETVKAIVAGFGELEAFQEVNYAGPCAHNLPSRGLRDRDSGAADWRGHDDLPR